MFNLTFVTPEKVIVLGQALREIRLPGERGELTILPGHAPLMTSLKPGSLNFVLESGESKTYVLNWGYCQVHLEGVSVMAELALAKDEIELELVKNSELEVNRKLAQETMSDSDLEKLHLERDWLQVEQSFLNQH